MDGIYSCYAWLFLGLLTCGPVFRNVGEAWVVYEAVRVACSSCVSLGVCAFVCVCVCVCLCACLSVICRAFVYLGSFVCLFVWFTVV